MNIIVLNLPRDIRKKELTELFENYGKVESCDLVMDKKTGMPKGFGFVEIKDDTAANAAITALHGTKIRNNKIRVKISDKAK